MKFGKQILAQQIPGWSSYYLDYKSLKKIISSLASNRPATEASAFILEEKEKSRPPVRTDVTPATVASLSASQLEDPSDVDIRLESTFAENVMPVDTGGDLGPNFQAHKTAFFFKLERELEKINGFYLQKEAELKLRLETLLSKRRAAATRVMPDDGDDTPRDHVEWKAVEEGFRLLARDLGNIQQFIDLNATGFRKILKKWDKRSKSATKELYLSRQVEVQPVFNRQLVTELSDIVASCLMDLTDLSIGLNAEGSAVNDMLLVHQIALERTARSGPFRDFETNLLKAVRNSDRQAIQEIVSRCDALIHEPGGKAHVTRIMWKGIIEAPRDLADFLLTCPATPFDFNFVDDINGRTCLHEAAITGQLRLMELCVQNGVDVHQLDLYGRNALHYASMNGHSTCCQRLISLGLDPSLQDRDSYTPLLYAVLNGHTECVQVLLNDGHVNVEPVMPSNDMIPLSLACQAGHLNVVLMLLDQGAKSIPNTNGEYPIHLAAREGHSDICRLLKAHDGWDLPDKYNEWTPLFHAARYGHENCVRVLIELGSRASAVDETGKEAIFYAAWCGHMSCVDLLLDAMSQSPQGNARRIATPQISPLEFKSAVETEFDMIPSLSLPPPIMPYRVYGHNYLDKACLVVVSVGHPFTAMSDQISAVNLHPRITNASAVHAAHYPHASSLLKLVMTSKPDITSAPYSVPIPVGEEKDVFMFQTLNSEALSLEFSIYPNFGTKTIGRAIALPSLIQNRYHHPAMSLPILDHHLHSIGEVHFEASIITPFKEATLEIGGAVETYWKSLAMPYNTGMPQKASPRILPTVRSTGSTYTSPSAQSVGASAGHTVTLSSVSGEYIHLVVQCSRDLQPVIYNAWKLPVSEFDLGVADLTFQQLQNLSYREGRSVEIEAHKSSSIGDWHSVLANCLISLERLVKFLPPELGLYLDLAYPSLPLKSRLSLGHVHDVNDFVDSVLRVIYQTSTVTPHRRIVFGSFSPEVCAALNWKQPNYPVFLASECGVMSQHPPSSTALSPLETNDRRLSSIAATVDWAKSNNLLGILLDADFLVKVPALVQGVKDVGLLVGAYGSREQTATLLRAAATEPNSVDAVQQGGIISFLDHGTRNLI